MPTPIGSPVRLVMRWRDVQDIDGVMTDMGPFDLTGRTIELIVQRPDGTTVRITDGIVIEGSPTLGVAVYQFPAGYLSAGRIWKAQGYADSYPAQPVTWQMMNNLPLPSP